MKKVTKIIIISVIAFIVVAVIIGVAVGLTLKSTGNSISADLANISAAIGANNTGGSSTNGGSNNAGGSSTNGGSNTAGGSSANGGSNNAGGSTQFEPLDKYLYVGPNTQACYNANKNCQKENTSSGYLNCLVSANCL